MDIFEVCEKFSISYRKARKMDKAGVLRLDENTPEPLLEIRYLLMRGQPLSTAHLVNLIDNPSWVVDLGRYSDKAELMLSALGNVKEDKAPLNVTAYIADATRGDIEAINVIKKWICKTIPVKGQVPHNWLATRLLLGVPVIDRKNDAPRLPRVFLNVRKCDDFKDWWKVSKVGTRSQTFYFRPKNFLDL